MSKVTIQNVLDATKQSEVFDLANAIRNSSSDYFKQFVPLANMDNVADWGDAMRNNPQIQNEFITSLVNRIGRVVIHSTSLRNPLSRFKQPTMELGDTIEEIFVDLTKEHIYDPELAETEAFKREIPNVHTLYHKLNREGFFEQTIQQRDLQKAFVSWDSLGSFVARVMTAMQNSAEVAEYSYMKMLLAKYYADGHFKLIDQVANTPQNRVEKARAIATRMTLPQGSRNFNSMNVHTTTDPSDLIIIMTPELEANIDVNVLASAFNMDKASFMGQRILMEDLPQHPTSGEKIELIIADKSLFMVADVSIQTRAQENARGLYWNYYLHVSQILSTSRFANAVALVSQASGTKRPISEVLVEPAISTIKKTVAKKFNIIPRFVDGRTYDTAKLSYSVRVLDDGSKTAITTGVTTSISNGVLTVTLASGVTASGVIVEVTTDYTYGTQSEDPDKFTWVTNVYAGVTG